jgi:hypothetical protein
MFVALQCLLVAFAIQVTAKTTVFRQGRDLQVQADGNINLVAESVNVNGVAFTAGAGNCNQLKPIICEDADRFKPYQSIPTTGAHDWHSFEVNNTLYLLVANYRNDDVFELESELFKFDSFTNLLVPLQK